MLILGIVVLVSISGCVGPDGDVYQRYFWVGGLYHLYDTNPSTPAIVTNGSYGSSGFYGFSLTSNGYT